MNHKGTSSRNADQLHNGVGQHVKLLKNFNVVGLGKVANGDHVHGKVIPLGFFKVEVSQILPEINVLYTF